MCALVRRLASNQEKANGSHAGSNPVEGSTSYNGHVVQLERMPVYEAGCWGFESSRGHHYYRARLAQR
jgi:hypothetical protein